MPQMRPQKGHFKALDDIVKLLYHGHFIDEQGNKLADGPCQWELKATTTHTVWVWQVDSAGDHYYPPSLPNYADGQYYSLSVFTRSRRLLGSYTFSMEEKGPAWSDSVLKEKGFGKLIDADGRSISIGLALHCFGREILLAAGYKKMSTTANKTCRRLLQQVYPGIPEPKRDPDANIQMDLNLKDGADFLKVHNNYHAHA